MKRFLVIAAIAVASVAFAEPMTIDIFDVSNCSTAAAAHTIRTNDLAIRGYVEAIGFNATMRTNADSLNLIPTATVSIVTYTNSTIMPKQTIFSGSVTAPVWINVRDGIANYTGASCATGMVRFCLGAERLITDVVLNETNCNLRVWVKFNRE